MLTLQNNYKQNLHMQLLLNIVIVNTNSSYVLPFCDSSISQIQH